MNTFPLPNLTCPRTVRTNANRLGFIAAAAVALALGVAAAAVLPPAAPARIALEVTTADGMFYIAGEGDTCPEAWQGAYIPENWTVIECAPMALSVR